MPPARDCSRSVSLGTRMGPRAESVASESWAPPDLTVDSLPHSAAAPAAHDSSGNVK